MLSSKEPVGNLIKQWRQRRRLSQMDLAGESEISSRHLSFLETGRSLPSREMLLRLADQLEVPLRERNVLLVSAGYAPMFSESNLQSPDLEAAREAIEILLAAHEPHPALAIDGQWNLVAANRSVQVLLSELKPEFLQPPANVLRLSFHPEGLAPRIENIAEWRLHIFTRLRRQIEATSNPKLVDLLNELQSYPPGDSSHSQPAEFGYAGIVIPFRLSSPLGMLSFISTTTVFGTPLDITLSELALETFFPADPQTAERLRQIAR